MTATSTKCVVLISGGLDSTVLLAERLAAGREVLPLSCHYGQRHSRELTAADAVLKHYGLARRTVALTALAQVAKGSSQLGDMPVPHGHYADESMKVTVVPNRNMVMLSVAVAYAISEAAAEVAYAAHAGDHAIYPDCRPEFSQAMRRAISLCDYPERSPLLLTPFIDLTKAEIVLMGKMLNVPMGLTYSCYEGQREHCGRCGTCVERREAFTLAGVPDPTVYTS